MTHVGCQTCPDADTRRSHSVEKHKKGRTAMKFTKTLMTGAAAVILASLSVTAKAEDDVRLRLNWMYYGSHAGFAGQRLWNTRVR